MKKLLLVILLSTLSFACFAKTATTYDFNLLVNDQTNQGYTILLTPYVANMKCTNNPFYIAPNKYDYTLCDITPTNTLPGYMFYVDAIKDGIIVAQRTIINDKGAYYQCYTHLQKDGKLVIGCSST